MVELTSVDVDTAVVVEGIGGNVESLWPKREANGVGRRAEDCVGVLRRLGRG